MLSIQASLLGPFCPYRLNSCDASPSFIPPSESRGPMKRKKWSEREERTLLSKYSDLLNSGALAKLKTREKKFKPIAEHVNALHHLQDPVTFPFKWSWRDVSIKVQNMRHQYLGVKQKIRISNNEFNWDDGEIHWENFLKYKQVFGDIELTDGGKDIGKSGSGLGNSNSNANNKKFGEEKIPDILGDEGIIGLGYGMDRMDSEEIEDEDEEEADEDEEEEEEEEGGEVGVDLEVGDRVEDDGGAKEVRKDQSVSNLGKKLEKKGVNGRRLRMVGAKVVELRDVIVRREDKRREREWNQEVSSAEKGKWRQEREARMQQQLNEREERIHRRELELEERQISWAKREVEKRMHLERELVEERRQRMKLEEKWEEQEMDWRERMVQGQIEHEKQMMQIQADACQNQLQILGAVARLICQFFGPTNDGLTGNMGALPPQVLQNLQHSEGLGNEEKPGATLPSEFL